MIEPLYPGYRSRILHEYPSVTRKTPRVLGNAVAGSTAVRFYLPSVQEYVVFLEFECIYSTQIFVRAHLKKERSTLSTVWSLFESTISLVQPAIPAVT